MKRFSEYGVGFDGITQETSKFETPQIKEGVNLMFEQHPELLSAGTPEQYTQYLESIFPDSKVKDIVYHGTASKEKIEKFDFAKSNYAKAVFFTRNYEFAKAFAFDDNRNGSVQEQLLRIKKPFDFSNTQHIQELRPIIEELIKVGYTSKNTGIRFHNNLPTINIGEREIQNPTIDDFVQHYMWRLENGSWRIIESDRVMDYISKKFDSIIIKERGVENIAVFSNDQIHVLGTKEDILQFKQFVKKLN